MAEKIPRKGERTRSSILEAAYGLFIEQGYHATSMRQIAERSGLALGGIYNHFSGKEAIFAEIIIDRHPYKQILPLLMNAPGDDVEQFVWNAARTMVEGLGRRSDFFKLMFIEVVEFNGRNMPRLMEVVIPQVLPLIQRFSKDSVRPIPPFILFRVFIGLFFSYYITELFIANTPIAASQKEALDHFVAIFLRGILNNEERP